jgi:hypothetical protein
MNMIRDAIYTCVNPLVLGTVAVLQGLIMTPGVYFEATTDRVAALKHRASASLSKHQSR